MWFVHDRYYYYICTTYRLFATRMKCENIFINLSHHPSSGWSHEQLESARKYGDIVDMAFPQVEPLMTSNQIKALASKLVGLIMTYGNPTDITVHVMGEMTLVYHIVSRLKRRGVRCVASTTERVATVVDGKNVSEFHFVQYREY